MNKYLFIIAFCPFLLVKGQKPKYNTDRVNITFQQTIPDNDLEYANNNKINDVVEKYSTTQKIAQGISNGKYTFDTSLKIVNVKAYGAVGDGLTDDAVAIQNAINTAKVVYFPTADYKVLTSLNLNDSTVLLGNNSCLFSKVLTTTGATSQNIITANRKNNVQIHDLILDGRYNSQSANDNKILAGQPLINIYNCENVLMENVKVKNHTANWNSKRDINDIFNNINTGKWGVIEIIESTNIVINNLVQENIRIEGTQIFGCTNIKINGFTSFKSPHIWTPLHCIGNDSIYLNKLYIQEGTTASTGSSINFISNHFFSITNSFIQYKNGIDIGNELKNPSTALTRMTSYGLIDNVIIAGNRNAIYDSKAIYGTVSKDITISNCTLSAITGNALLFRTIENLNFLNSSVYTAARVSTILLLSPNNVNLTNINTPDSVFCFLEIGNSKLNSTVGNINMNFLNILIDSKASNASYSGASSFIYTRSDQETFILENVKINHSRIIGIEGALISRRAGKLRNIEFYNNILKSGIKSNDRGTVIITDGSIKFLNNEIHNLFVATIYSGKIDFINNRYYEFKNKPTYIIKVMSGSDIASSHIYNNVGITNSMGIYFHSLSTATTPGSYSLHSNRLRTTFGGGTSQRNAFLNGSLLQIGNDSLKMVPKIDTAK